MVGNNEDFEVLCQSSDSLERFVSVLEYVKENYNKKVFQDLGVSASTEEESFAKAAVAIANVAGTQLYRKKRDSDALKTLIWLSQVKEKSISVFLDSRGDVNFDGLSKDALKEIAELSKDENSLFELKEILKQRFGVLVIYHGPFPSLKVDGCSFVLENGIPVVGMSLRYARYDYFWFTLMHELSHICLHYGKLSEPNVDDISELDDTEMEREADVLSSNSLIPRQSWREVSKARSLSELKRLCSELDLHPAIAAGRIRNKRKNYALFSEIVNKLDVRELLHG